MRGFLIPADQDRPIVETHVDKELVTRFFEAQDQAVESAFYDRDAIALVGETGRTAGMDRNDRASDWVVQHSHAAQQGRVGPDSPGFGLYGDVIMIGRDQDGRLCDLPERFDVLNAEHQLTALRDRTIELERGEDHSW